MRSRVFAIGALALLLAGGCAQSIPEQPGAYIKVGRAWRPLALVDTAKLQPARPADLDALEGVVSVDAGGAEIAFVGKKPERLAALVRDGEKWKPASTAAVPHEKRDGVWMLQVDGDAAGLVLVRVDDPRKGIAYVNGPDAAFSFALGAARFKAGKLEPAREALEVAEEAAPKAAYIKNELARVLAALKTDLSAAKSRANEAIGLAADDAERALYYDTLGEVYFVDGDVEKGIEAVDRAITLDLRNPAFHSHLTALIEKAQDQPPEAVFRRFFELLQANQLGDAADLANPFDVERLDDADQLDPALRAFVAGGPFAKVEIIETLKHGRTTRVKYALVGQDGSRRVADVMLQFDKKRWTVGLQ